MIWNVKKNLRYEGCSKSRAQLLIKTKKSILKEKLHYNPSM